ncbi:MAG: hypothetical protein ACRDCE_05605 [Cetobacterium sp.]|uniref:hypothetical protein n=1 Tax=Cetobacterium sp. TaxID=2071632 RepID=UPI003EE7F141
MNLPVFKPAQIKQPLKRFKVQLVGADENGEQLVIYQHEVEAVSELVARHVFEWLSGDARLPWYVQFTEVEGAE